MARSGEESGGSVAPLTLLVGGLPRAGAEHLAIDALTGVPTRRYREVCLQMPLESLPDAWSVLRSIWAWVEQDGVLTVTYRTGGVDRLRDVDAESLLRLASFEIVAEKSINGLRRLRTRSLPRREQALTCSVIVPCRNEVDNVGPLVERMPPVGAKTELIFVDGASSDGSADRVQSLIQRYPERDIKLLRQQHVGGKASAVFQGFDGASGDIVMILDADMTVAPEDLPRFYLAIAEGIADFANGSRFAYPMQAGAMPPINKLGNRAFGALLSWVLDSHITDSLCGTKAFRRSDWAAIHDARPLFGGHDPWGDFDLLLGAAYTGLRIVDVPVRYYARVAGESKMRPLRHGLSLAQTSWAGIRRLKLHSTSQSGA